MVPTANGVKSYHQLSLANDEISGKEATDQSRPTKKTEPLVQGGECELPQPGGKDDTLGTEEVKKDVEARAEVQALPGKAETEPLRMPAERDAPGAGEDIELPQAGTTKFLQTAENILSLETAQELPPEEAMGRDKQPQVLEAIPKENSSPEIAEGSQSAENGEKQQLSEAPSEAEQPQVLEIVLRENETPQMPDGSQLVPTPVMNDSPCEAPDGVRNESQVTRENRVHPVGTAETAAEVEMTREIHPDKEEPHIEGKWRLTRGPTARVGSKGMEASCGARGAGIELLMLKRCRCWVVEIHLTQTQDCLPGKHSTMAQFSSQQIISKTQAV